MRRIVLAGLGTVSSVVLLLAYPTSHNESVASTSAPVAGSDAGSSSSSSSSSSSDPGTAPSASSASSSSSSSSSTGSSSSSSASHSSSSSGTKTYTGDAVQTRWGTVQVKITVTNGKITKSEAVQYPNDNPRDQEINSYALPILAQEVVKAQSASIDAVSGATVTSGGYIQSLQSAVDAAHL